MARMCKTPPLLAVEVVRTGEACPFTNEKVGFELRQGEVVWLRGASGAGKSFTCLHLAGLAELPGARVHAQWNSSVPAAERVGFLFQKGVLIDSLNLAENIALALLASAQWGATGIWVALLRDLCERLPACNFLAPTRLCVTAVVPRGRCGRVPCMRVRRGTHA